MMPRAGQPRPRGGHAPALFAFVVLLLWGCDDRTLPGPLSLATSAAVAESISSSPTAEVRIALVIGNGAYREAPLNNPPNDARLIADTLKRLGFTVIGAKPGEPLIDADLKTMKRAIRSFSEQLERVGSGGVGLFFYAGHAVQANGKNYLVPVGADIKGEADLEDDAVSADSVLARMTYAGVRVNLVVLDACRNNPYRGRFRSPTRGLAEMSAPSGSLVAYSTAPGDVAEDGTGKNSPYSLALAEAMEVANVLVELTFKRVRSDVMQATGNRQVPWESSSLIGDFYFAQTALVPPPVQQPNTADIPTTFPEAATLRRVAVLEFTGKGSNKIASALEAALAEHRVHNVPYFSVMDRAKTKYLIAEVERGLSGEVAPGTAARFGKQIGVQGVFFGRVNSHDVAAESYTGKQCIEHSASGCKKYLPTNCTKLTARVSIMTRLLNVVTEQIVYSRERTGVAVAPYCSGDAAESNEYY